MDVYEEAMQENGPMKGSGTAGEWLNFPMPAAVNSRTQKRLRVIRRLQVDDKGVPLNPIAVHSQFWVVVDQHGWPGAPGSNKKWDSIVCADTALHSSASKGDSSWRAHMTCPICKLQEELWKLKDPALDSLTKMLRHKRRVFMQVIDMDDVGSHWKKDDKGNWLPPKAKVWGTSREVFNTLLKIIRVQSAIEDHMTGRDLIVEAEKTGPEKFNVKWHVQALDKSAVATELLPIVWAAGDLAGLAPTPDMNALAAAAARLDPRKGSHGVAPGAPTGYVPPAAPQGYMPQQAMPPAYPQAPPMAAPPTPAHPMGGGTLYNYVSATGQQMPAPLPASEIAKWEYSQQGGQAWTAGLPNWVPASSLPEIANAVNQLRQPPPPAAPPPGSYAQNAYAPPPMAGPPGGYAPAPAPYGGPPAAPTPGGYGGPPPQVAPPQTQPYQAAPGGPPAPPVPPQAPAVGPPGPPPANPNWGN